MIEDYCTIVPQSSARKFFPTVEKMCVPRLGHDEDLMEEVRKHHIPDFSNWKNHDAFEVAFTRLEKDLRASVSR